MQTNEILATIDKELAHLRQVRAILIGEQKPVPTSKRRGRPKGSKNKPQTESLPDQTASKQTAKPARVSIAAKSGAKSGPKSNKKTGKKAASPSSQARKAATKAQTRKKTARAAKSPAAASIAPTPEAPAADA